MPADEPCVLGGEAVHVQATAEDWRGLDQQELDAAFNVLAAVPESASILADWESRSAELRAQYPDTLQLPYGPGERNRTDLLKAASGAPTLVFIHGGYWQMASKERVTFCATGPMSRGINVALMGYTLAPEANLDEMIAEIRAGLRQLALDLPKLGGDPDRIIVSGWSAGGHLASMVQDEPCVSGGLSISGLFDLMPIRHSYLNAKLGLDDASAVRNSPIQQKRGRPVPMMVVAGSEELPISRAQSADYAAHRALQRLPVHYEEIPGTNHFSILEELAAPAGRITQLVATLAGVG